MEAREQLLAQMTEEILAHRDVFLDSADGSTFSFEFQEIEDRYSVRLNSLNVLLEHLEYRQPRVLHRVETVTTTLASVNQSLDALLGSSDDWELGDFEVVRLEGDQVLLIAVLVCDEAQE